VTKFESPHLVSPKSPHFSNEKDLPYKNGIATGASLGLILRLLFREDNIAWGMSIGLCLGLVIFAIADARCSTIEGIKRQTNNDPDDKFVICTQRLSKSYGDTGSQRRGYRVYIKIKILPMPILSWFYN
jgi:hypothetical protein